MTPFDHDLSTTTLPALLRTAARHAPANGVSLLDRRGKPAGRRTYPELLASIEVAAERLSAAGLRAGDRMLACLPTSWELLEHWFGAVFCGALPVLVAPPGALGGGAAHAEKLKYIFTLLRPRFMVCDDTTRKLMLEFGADDAAAQTRLPEELAGLAPLSFSAPGVAPGDLAFLQLTSGSTGHQRAVAISHGNIVHNTFSILDFLGREESDTVVSWLPLHHDMGLVGCLLFAISRGANIVLMRPETFLARPQVWLQQISAFPVTLSPAPNFAYQLCVERVDPRGLDLQLESWKVALTGAEMIRPETFSAFLDKFAPYGLSEGSLLASYGMAECTLAATADLQRKGLRSTPMAKIAGASRDLRDVVSCGKPVRDSRLRIATPTPPYAEVRDGVIGEIWFSGPGVFQGYFEDEAATSESLAMLDGARWLRTGDLGFVRDGELYVTGRIKELLIVHGHNLMPHELEWHAEAAAGSGGTERCGAFSVSRDETGEQAVMVLEVATSDREQLALLERDIRTRVGQSIGIPLADVVLVKRGTIPKTTSGKVQRSELKQRYLDGRLEKLQ
jgi:acyl-CoA synthetase (AMP-forming)/AMP-acid ligase II